MAQYRDDPMTDEEFDELREKMDETRQEVKEYLNAQGVDVSQWDDSRTEPRADGGE
jgi:DNA-binding transcriptional regulator YiaG